MFMRNDLLKLIEHNNFQKMTTKDRDNCDSIKKMKWDNSDSLGIGLRLLGLGTVLGEVPDLLAVETN